MMCDFSRFLFLLALALPFDAHVQEPKLTIRNGDQAVTLSIADLSEMPLSRLSTDGPEAAEYEGVTLVELLKRVGVTFGQTFRGPRLATYLLATARDGYRVVIALPEIDPDFSRHPGALVAIRQNGKPLAPRDGPLQVILPGDTRHARWMRGLASLTVRAAPEVK